jgi:hypothetical protein
VKSQAKPNQTKLNFYFRADSEGQEEDTTSELEQQVRELNRNPDLPLLAAADSETDRRQLREERKQLEEDVAAFEAEKRGKAAHEAETEEHVRRMEAEIVRLQTREKVAVTLFSCMWKFMFSRVTSLFISFLMN